MSGFLLRLFCCPKMLFYLFSACFEAFLSMYKQFFSIFLPFQSVFMKVYLYTWILIWGWNDQKKHLASLEKEAWTQTYAQGSSTSWLWQYRYLLTEIYSYLGEKNRYMSVKCQDFFSRAKKLDYSICIGWLMCT